MSLHVLALKALLLVTIGAIIGLPILATLEVLAFFAAVLVIAFGTLRRPPQRYVWPATAVIAACLSLVALLPQIRMQEGHNLFLVQPGLHEVALRQALPEPIYAHAKATFERNYAVTGACAAGCWRNSGEINTPFAFSADGALQHPQYSRIVDFPLFDSLASFRGSFTNSRSTGGLPNLDWLDDNAGANDPVRAALPYFVVYTIPSSLVGQTLCATGDTFWQSPLAVPVHAATHGQQCRTLAAADVGAKFYGLSIDPRLKLSVGFRIRPTPAVIAHLVRRIARLVAVFALLALFVIPAWPSLALFAALAAPPVLAVGASALYRNARDPLFLGGSDQLVHWGFGIKVLQDAMSGQWSDALRGSESVFYFMPGYRYVRAVEMLVFGDSGFFALIALVATPCLIVALARAAFGWQTALAAVPVSWLAFHLGATKLWALAEGVAYPALMLALLCAIRAISQPQSRADVTSIAMAAGLAAFATILRPNVGIAAIVMLTALLAVHPIRQRFQVGLLIAAAFAPVGLMLLHNLAYGHRFVLATSASDIPENLFTSPAVYMAAALNLITFKWHDPAIVAVFSQLRAWIFGDGGLPLLALAAIIGATAFVRGRAAASTLVRTSLTTPPAILLLATVVGLELPLLVFAPSGRYAFLAAYLALILVLALAITATGLAAVRWPPRILTRQLTQLMRPQP